MKPLISNLKIRKNLAFIITTLILITTGCTNNNENENNITTTTETTTESNTLENETKEETVVENIEFDCFKTEEKELNDLIYKDNFETVEEFWYEDFTNAVDMIFYGKEYKGTTWDKLSQELQKESIDTLLRMEKSISIIDPNYKEDFEKTKNFVIDIYLKGLEKLKEKIGEDNYNKGKDIINETKEKVEEKGKEIGNNIQNYLNEEYQKYKNSHQK